MNKIYNRDTESLTDEQYSVVFCDIIGGSLEIHVCNIYIPETIFVVFSVFILLFDTVFFFHSLCPSIMNCIIHLRAFSISFSTNA